MPYLSGGCGFCGRLLGLLKQARRRTHTVGFIEPTTCCLGDPHGLNAVRLFVGYGVRHFWDNTASPCICLPAHWRPAKAGLTLVGGCGFCGATACGIFHPHPYGCFNMPAHWRHPKGCLTLIGGCGFCGATACGI